MDPHWNYLGWDRPFSIALAEVLRREMSNGNSLDNCLVWVPSARTGRHVLNELFSGEADGVEAFHPPRLVTPAQFVRSLLIHCPDAASEAQSLQAWKAVLDEASPASLAGLFTAVPVEQKTAWAYSVGQQLMRLRDRLAEDNMDFRKVAAEPLQRDGDRWAVLGRLETAYLEQLEARGLQDAAMALEALVQAPVVDPAYKKVIIAGVLNLSRRQAACLEGLSKAGLSVEFHVPAPESRSGDFDMLGRPRCGIWEIEPLEDSLLDGRIQRAAEPRQLVDHVLQLSAGYRRQVDALVVGSPEPETSRYLIERSRLTPTPYYAPEGKALAETEWGRLLFLLIEFQRTGQLGILFDLFGHSLFREWAWKAGCSPERMQCAILHLKREHLFRNLGELEDPGLGPSGSIADVRAGLARMQEVLFPEPPEQTGFAEWIWHFLQSIAAAARLDSESRGILDQLEELLQDLQSDFDERTTAIGDYWELLRYLLESTQTYPERGAEERPVSGWLELPWETAPHLVIIGLPEKQVPGPKNLDSFLTPILCRQLGLYGPDELVAFHAFRLRLILECRRSWGRVDLLLPDRGLDDEPARHCRFLFLARESQILDRVNLLLGERPVEESPLPASFGTRLKLPDPRPLERLSVTAFRSYLQHPFHFLLQNRLYWSAPEPLPRELDAMTFGSLAHEVLERLNASAEGRDLKGPDPIAAFLLRELDLVAARKFGSRLPVPLQIQLESMRERLRAAAREIARAREAGWVPEYAEWAFNADSGTRLEIGGIVISGKIDLIERNSRTGEVRITDYKTSDSGTGAEASHLSQLRSNSGEPPVAACDFERAGKPWRWKDMQLPLYQIAAERFLGTRPSCAYFNLSKAVTEIRIDEWNPEPELSEAALACAAAIIEHIRKGEFPVTAKSRFEDSWLDWFGGDYTATLDADWLARHGELEP